MQVSQVEGHNVEYQMGDETLQADQVVLDNLHVVVTGEKAPFDPQALGRLKLMLHLHR